MKQTYIGPQHTYTRIEGETRRKFIEQVPTRESREGVVQLVTELAGGDRAECLAYAEGFARAYYRETAPNMDNSYRVHDGIPGIEDPHPELAKHIQAGWINGRNTRLAAKGLA